MLKPMPVSAIKAEVFVTSKVKKKVAAITPMPRTALFLEGENGMAIPVSIHCDGNSEISTNTRKKDAIITSPIVDSGNICKDSEAIAGKLLKPSAIHFSSLADEKRRRIRKILQPSCHATTELQRLSQSSMPMLKICQSRCRL